MGIREKEHEVYFLERIKNRKALAWFERIFSWGNRKSFNDVDLALKLHESGYRTVWTPQALLFHFESVTRDPTVSQREVNLLFRRWEASLHDDPYGNPNLEPKCQVWTPRGAR